VLEGLHRRSLRLLRRVPPRVLERVVRLRSPSYTLGTACLVEHEGRVLLVRTAYRRNWSLPGGLLDRGEAPADGLRRELREEVGVDVDVDGDPVVLVDLGSQLVEFFFHARLTDGADVDCVRAASAEIEEVGWFALDEARELVHGPSRLREKFAILADRRDGRVVVLERGRVKRSS
jgi:ADP-ribose pyrophosphatase YjhB (NUDIX family)